MRNFGIALLIIAGVWITLATYHHFTQDEMYFQTYNDSLELAGPVTGKYCNVLNKSAEVYPAEVKDFKKRGQINTAYLRDHQKVIVYVEVVSTSNFWIFWSRDLHMTVLDYSVAGIDPNVKFPKQPAPIVIIGDTTTHNNHPAPAKKHTPAKGGPVNASNGDGGTYYKDGIEIKGTDAYIHNTIVIHDYKNLDSTKVVKNMEVTTPF